MAGGDDADLLGADEARLVSTPCTAPSGAAADAGDFAVLDDVDAASAPRA
jgi:hypothetical protein